MVNVLSQWFCCSTCWVCSNKGTEYWTISNTSCFHCSCFCFLPWSWLFLPLTGRSAISIDPVPCWSLHTLFQVCRCLRKPERDTSLWGPEDIYPCSVWGGGARAELHARGDTGEGPIYTSEGHEERGHLRCPWVESYILGAELDFTLVIDHGNRPTESIGTSNYPTNKPYPSL